MNAPYQRGYLAWGGLQSWAKELSCPRCGKDPRRRNVNEVCAECKASDGYKEEQRIKKQRWRRASKLSGGAGKRGRPRIKSDPFEFGGRQS
jgi:ribosomal protein L37E